LKDIEPVTPTPFSCELQQQDGSVEGEQQQSDDVEEGEGQQQRATWGNPIEFLMSCISLSVGLGNIWRFPFTAVS
jgi:solute carrier family 6 amino acid transporter-like protein 5/7/9/14